MLTDDLWREGLTDKQQNLVAELYFNMGILSPEVWQAAGYKTGTTAKNWIRKKQARVAIRMFAELQIDVKKDITKAGAIAVLHQMAFYNPFDIIDSEGKLKPEYREECNGDPKRLKNLAVCVQGIKTKLNKFGKKEAEIKLANPLEALKMLIELMDLKNNDTEDPDGEKSIHDMDDKERLQEIKQYMKKLGYKQTKKIEFKKDEEK